MEASEVIESYVADVAARLPRRQRHDVAFELRALLEEELQGRAADAGRPADAAIALELVNAFGRPAVVAARYRPALLVIDPADGHSFVRATMIGLVIIWVAGLLALLQQPLDGDGSVMRAISWWYWSVLIRSLWWPGLLVVGYALAAWSRRRWPQAADWKPRSAELGTGNRAALATGIVGILCGLYVLADPRWLLDLFWGGRAAAAAYEALTYTETFRARQGPFVFGVVLLNVPLLAAVLIRGRWSPSLRRLETALALAMCAVLAWTLLDGPVFMAPASDGSARFALAVIVIVTLAGMGLRTLRAVRPAPQAAAGKSGWPGGAEPS